MSMNMIFCWITDQVILEELDVQWHPDQKHWPRTTTYNTLMASTTWKYASGTSMSTTHNGYCQEHKYPVL